MVQKNLKRKTLKMIKIQHNIYLFKTIEFIKITKHLNFQYVASCCKSIPFTNSTLFKSVEQDGLIDVIAVLKIA